METTTVEGNRDAESCPATTLRPAPVFAYRCGNITPKWHPFVQVI